MYNFDVFFCVCLHTNLNATFAATCFLFRKESWPEWSLDLAWLPIVLLPGSTWETYCWCASHLRACHWCCTDAEQTRLPSCRTCCSAVQIQEVQNNYVWVKAELRLLFIQFCSQHLQFFQGFWISSSVAARDVPSPSVRRIIPCLVNWEEAKLVLKFDALYFWWVLIGIRCVVVLKLTVEQRIWGSHIGKVLQTFKITASCPRAHCCPSVKKWENRLVL